MPTIKIENLASEVAARLRRKIRASGVDKVLIAQAQRRINARGDSTHRYPELWATRVGKGQRAGGQPLRDTGKLASSLRSKSRVNETGVEFALVPGVKYAEGHQTGYTTKGPNFIPLTAKAKRHRKGVDPKDEGLVLGEDYIMAWGGVSVPQRKIFNTPPEDVRELADEIKSVIGDS